MTVDVSSEIVIRCPRNDVADYASNPDNAPRWYVNIKSVEWKTTPPLAVGSQIAFVAHFLGRKIAYTYDVVELVRGERFVMRTAEGPFPMEKTRAWATTPEGATPPTGKTWRRSSSCSKLAVTRFDTCRSRARHSDASSPSFS